jgi:hypothetical protein
MAVRLTKEDFERRVEELCKLEPGWFEGAGGTYKKEDFENIKNKLYSSNIPIPYLFPNPSPNVINLEWDAFGFDHVVELNIVSNEFECFTILISFTRCEGKYDLNKDWDFLVSNFKEFEQEANHFQNKWFEEFGSGEPKPKSIKSILKTIWRKIKGGK